MSSNIAESTENQMQMVDDVQLHKATEQKVAIEQWIQRFDELFLALCKSEQVDQDGALFISLQKGKSKKEVVSVKLNIKDYQPNAIELAVDTNNKLTVKRRKETDTDDDICIEDSNSNEALDLTFTTEEEKISADEEDCGYLVIKAPMLDSKYKENGALKTNVNLTNPKSPKSIVSTIDYWNQFVDDHFLPLVHNADRKD